MRIIHRMDPDCEDLVPQVLKTFRSQGLLKDEDGFAHYYHYQPVNSESQPFHTIIDVNASLHPHVDLDTILYKVYRVKKIDDGALYAYRRSVTLTQPVLTSAQYIHQAGRTVDQIRKRDDLKLYVGNTT